MSEPAIQTQPAKTMWAVGTKKNQYSSDHNAPITLVEDRVTAESLKSLLDAAGSTTAYMIEIPMWPAMRTEN